MSLNLAKRPFVNTRPANVVTVFLALIGIALTIASWRTVTAYRDESKKTRLDIASLDREIARLEDRRRAAEASLGRYNIPELNMSAGEADQLARRRAFSWTRLLTRLEAVLPTECRVVSISF